MDPNTGNSASAAGPKKDKKSKKNYEDGDGKKKFVSIFRFHYFHSIFHFWTWILTDIPCDVAIIFWGSNYKAAYWQLHL